MRTPLLQKYDHCEFTDIVKKLLTQHCSLSKGLIHVIKAYTVCSQTLPVQVTFLWSFYGKEYLQIPGCLALTTSFGHHRCSFVDPPLSLHILRYAEGNTEPWCYLWQSFQALKAAKKEHSVMESKMIPGHGVLTTHLHLADIPRCKCQPGEPSISTENTWSQNWGKIYLEGNSPREAVTCTDVKSSVFRVTLHIQQHQICRKRDVFTLSDEKHTYTHASHISSVLMFIWQFPEILHLADSTGK